MLSAFVTDMNAVRFKLQFEICNLKSEMNMAAQKEGVSIYAMRSALCFTEVAQDRLEKYL